MTIVYEKEDKKYGNECVFNYYVFVVEVEYGFISCMSKISRGWFGIDTTSHSFVFEDLNSAISCCEDFLKENYLKE